MASHQKEIVSTRLPQAWIDELRRIAEREAETQSTIVRRLVRKGLDVEQRAAQVGQ